MRKKAWFFRNRTGLGILGVVLVFGMMAAGCPTGNEDPPVATTTYTVTFNTDGGSDVEKQTVEEGKTVTKPADPTKDGKKFANWYKDADKTALWNFATDVVLKDTTLYAKWAEENAQTFKVTFDADGGSPAPVAQDVLQGEPVVEPAKPSKTGYIFGGWYNGEDEWNFATNTVTEAITLKANWVQAVTVTFDTKGGSAINPVTVASGSGINLYSYRPSKTGNVFEGWYTDEACTIPAGSDWLTVSSNITLYAKWISTSELAPYAGVWRRNGDRNESYWLQSEGTGWNFSEFNHSPGFNFGNTRWSTSQISGQEGTFNAEKTQFTPSNGGSAYTKNTTETKTPAAATGNLLGTWLSGNRSIELKADGNAVLNADSSSITLKYRAETNAVYLLTPTDNLVIASITVSNGKLAGFSKPTTDNALAGIWKLTKGSQDYYWNLKADGSGTFHTLGASVPFSFTITEDGDKRIDGRRYTVSGDTLSFPDQELTLTKVDSLPSGSGADGDSRLHGAWNVTQGGMTMTITFNPNGVLLVQMDREDGASGMDSGIWKADGTEVYFYYSNFSDSFGNNVSSYTVSDSPPTLTMTGGNGQDVTFTKQ